MTRQGLPALDRKITFLAATEGKDPDSGEVVATGWGEVASARASFTPVSDGERLRAAAVEQRAEARFVTRWTRALAEIDGQNRLRFDGADWQITGVKEVGRHLGLEFSAWKIREAGG
ncbi:head-tail adaptor protein [Pseudophaeobacter sp.]|jgi:head-tail adaptor|uniref:head-tail adaptor protein n=1 Tax=Pseudophaeobacter sp. TaxID=1971739 RepID=UPI0032D932B0